MPWIIYIYTFFNGGIDFSFVHLVVICARAAQIMTIRIVQIPDFFVEHAFWSVCFMLSVTGPCSLFWGLFGGVTPKSVLFRPPVLTNFTSQNSSGNATKPPHSYLELTPNSFTRKPSVDFCLWSWLRQTSFMQNLYKFTNSNEAIKVSILGCSRIPVS